MRLFVINLDRQPERFERMSNIFDDLGLPLERVDAVDGTTLSADDLIRLRRNPDARPGETACFLSHRKCWQRIVDEDLPYAAIFEDDLHIGADAAAVLSSGDWLPDDAGIVKIETMNRPVKIDKSSVALVDGRKVHRLRGTHTGGGAYILTRKGAKKLLKASEVFDDPVDHFMFNFDLPQARSLALFQLVPAVCIQDFVLDKKASSFIGLGSDLHLERTTKPKGLAKAWREIKRPFLQLFNFARRTAFNLFTDKNWANIPFK